MLYIAMTFMHAILVPCHVPRHVVLVGDAQYCGYVRMLEQAANDLYLMFSVVLYY